MRYKKLAILTAFLALLFIGAGETPPEEKAPRMTKEELKPMLGSKDLVVVDIRLDEQYLGVFGRGNLHGSGNYSPRSSRRYCP